jgi:hypothetical protein
MARGRESSAALGMTGPDGGRQHRLPTDPLVSTDDADARGPQATALNFAATPPEPKKTLKVMKYVTEVTFNIQLVSE